METDTLTVAQPSGLVRRALTFRDLVLHHLPRPIHDAAAYDETVAVIRELAGFDLNGDQEDYLEVLAGLVEAYDREHYRVLPAVAPHETLQYLLEEHGLDAAALAGLLGVGRSTAYKLLKGRRRLTAAHIAKLAERFGVSGDAFLPRTGA